MLYPTELRPHCLQLLQFKLIAGSYQSRALVTGRKSDTVLEWASETGGPPAYAGRHCNTL